MCSRIRYICAVVLVTLVVAASPARAATRLANITSSSKYLQYYGSDFSTSNLQVMSQFDVVVLSPNASSVTPAAVAYLQSNGVKYVLGYISIGEQMPGTPIIKGDGTGPVYCTTNGTATIMYESNNVASYYVDQTWSNTVYVTQDNGHVDTDGTFGGAYVYPNAYWQYVLNTQRSGGVPGTALSNMFVAGLGQIAGARTSDSDTSSKDDFGMNGFFLDTLDTAGPFTGVGSYPWAAQAMQATVAYIYNTYTNSVVFANRGLFFYNPLVVNSTFNVQPYAYTIRPYIHAGLFESYMLDSSTCDTNLNPYVNDDKYDYAPKINAEANRPDGFTMFSLDYQLNRGTNLYEFAMNQTICSNGWVEYLCPDGSLDTIGTYARNNPRSADTSAPVWSSTATEPQSGESTACPNDDSLSTNPTQARVGVQSVTAGAVPGDIVVHWDVAMDQTPPVKYNIYQSTNALFSTYTAYSNVVYQIGDGWATDPTTYSANQYTIPGLSIGTYYFRVRAQDSATPSHEDTNTVTLSITVVDTLFNAIDSGSIVVDGNLSDWASLTSFGQQPPDFITSTTNPVDLAQLRLAHDTTNLYLAYQNQGPLTSGLNAAENLYLDTDSNRSTGYRGGANNFPIGADYLLQGATLYRYTGSTGTDWNWTEVGLVDFAVAQSNAELSLPRMWLGGPTQINLFFFDDNTVFPGGTSQAQYPSGALQTGGGGTFLTYQFPDVANPVNSGSVIVGGSLTNWTRLTSFGVDPAEFPITSVNKLDLTQIWMAHGLTNFYVAYQNYGPVASNDLGEAYNLYLDVDGDGVTGYRGSSGNFPIGADYLLQGATLYQYTGTNGTDWSWSEVGIATWAVGGSNVEFSLPRAWLNNPYPSLVRLFFLGDNTAYGGSAEDLYPANALTASTGGGYCVYRVTEVSNPVAAGAIVVNGTLSDWSSLTSFGQQSQAVTITSSNKVDLAQIWLANDPTNLYVAYQNYGPTTNGLNAAYNLYFDVDDNRTTGFSGGANNFPIGAEYLLQGATLYHFTGTSGTDWSWSSVGVATYATSGSNVELSLPRAWIGNPEVFQIFFLDDNQSVGGTQDDTYPRTALQTGGGGTWLAYRLVSANPNLDSVGDGIPNWWRAMYFANQPIGNLDGLFTNSVSCAACDADGSGFSNLQDYLAGTNPTNPASAFRITSIVSTGANLLVQWTMGSGKTNALQVTPGDGLGNYLTNNFADLFTVTNTVGTVTNYTDIGAATNTSSRYYRVRRVP